MDSAIGFILNELKQKNTNIVYIIINCVKSVDSESTIDGFPYESSQICVSSVK